MITGPEPGLTRDAVAVRFVDEVGAIELVDTAGLRKKARVELALEKMSVSASIEALKMAEVVVLCVDAVEGLHEQDLQIGRLIEREGRACVLVLNKWDAVGDRGGTKRAIGDRLESGMAQMKGIPVVTLSGLTGAGVERLLPAIRDGVRGLEQAGADGGVEPLVHGRAGASCSAAGGRAAAEAAVCDSGEGAAADVHRVRDAGRSRCRRITCGIS